MNEITPINGAREFLTKWVFSPLAGVEFADWSRVLKRYGRGIPPRYWLRTAFTTAMSLVNSALAAREKKYRTDLASVEVKAPVFIIGHHRSGTTHLWRLLSCDERFIFPEVAETIFPETMLTFKNFAHFLAERFIPESRPQDNMKHSADAPLDEEWGLCTSTFLSTNMSRHFPECRDQFKYMLSLKDAGEEKQTRWKEALRLFAKKLQFSKANGRNTILFKAPDNTAKIRLILDEFPDARFIHIYRNPYRVFQSTLKMEKQSLPLCSYQRFHAEDLEPYIIWRYREMYEVYFEDRHLIPDNHFTEVAYEDLVQNRLETVQKIYRELNLHSFVAVKPNLISYIDTIADYQTNSYPPMPAAQKSKIATAWQPCFEAFGYPNEVNALKID